MLRLTYQSELGNNALVKSRYSNCSFPPFYNPSSSFTHGISYWFPRPFSCPRRSVGITALISPAIWRTRHERSGLAKRKRVIVTEQRSHRNRVDRCARRRIEIRIYKSGRLSRASTHERRSSPGIYMYECDAELRAVRTLSRSFGNRTEADPKRRASATS